MLQREQEKARRRQEARREEAKRAPASKAAKGRLSMVLGALFSKCTTQQRRSSTAPSQTGLPADLETRRRLQLKAVEVLQAHPDWSRNQVYAEAEQLLRLRR